MPETVRPCATRTMLQLAHPAGNGTGKILFRRGMNSTALPLLMPTPARLLAPTERSSERQMVGAPGQFSPAARQKICGQYPLQMPLTERPSVKLGPSSEQQTPAHTGSAREAEPLSSCVAFLSPTQITEQPLA